MIRHLLMVAALVLPGAAAAQHVEALAKCLADSTSGRDRKDLARWVFLAMAKHPGIQVYASPAAVAGSEEANRVMGATVMRLLTDSCVSQARTAIKEGGGGAIQVAFQTLGQLAMQELMNDKAVAGSMGAFEKHLDQHKLNKALTAP